MAGDADRIAFDVVDKKVGEVHARLRAEPFVTSTRSMVVLSRLVETPTVVPL